MADKTHGKKAGDTESLTAKVGFAYSLVMLFVFPLFLSKDYTSVTKGKYGFFLVSTIALAVLLILSYVVTIGEAKRRTEKPDFSISKILLFAYGAVNIISVIFSDFKNVENSSGKSALLFGMGRYNGLITLVLLLAVCIIVSYIGGFKKWLPAASSAAMLIISIIGIIQLSGINFAGLYPKSQHKGYYHEFVATIGNIDFLASLFCIMIPLAVAAAVFLEFHTAVRTAMLFSAGAGLYLLLATDVSSGVVGMAAFMLVFIPVMLLKKEWASKGLCAVGFLGLGVFFKLSVSYRYVEAEQKTYTEFSVSALCIAVLAAAILLIAAGFLTDGKIGKYNGKIIAVSAVLLEIGVIAAAVIYLAFFYNVEAGSGLMAEIAAFLQGKLTLHSGSRRVAIWKYSFEMGMEHPLLGHGTGVFKQAFSISKGADYAQVSNRALDMAHNDYLQIFCESGLIGLAAYLGYLATTFFRAVKAAVKNTNVLVLMIAAMCYLVQIFFSFNIVIVVPVFWVIMGLLENETVKSKKAK